MKYSQYRILKDSIEFDYYAFRYSSLRKNKTLTLDRIRNVDFNNFPYAMEIDEGEIIFFNHNDILAIKEFAHEHNLAISNSPNVWQILCSPFLDTELSETEIKNNHKILQELQFTSTVIKQIRKKIKYTLLGTWEWKYLGHWDLLAMKQSRNIWYRINGRKFTGGP